MSQEVLTALYSRPDDAADAAARLEALGIARGDISMIAADTETAPNWLIPTLTGAGVGVATAGPIGAAVGALVGAILPMGNAGEAHDRRGGTLIGVRVDGPQVEPAFAILKQRGSVGGTEDVAASASRVPVGAGELPSGAGHTGVASGGVSTPDPSTADTLTPADLAGNGPIAGSVNAGPVVDKDPESAMRDISPVSPHRRS